MKKILLSVLFAAASCPMALAQNAKTYLVTDFETGPGFEGPISRDEQTAKEGKASGKMSADFTNVADSPWITATKSLDLRNKITGVSFWIKTSDANQITVRLIDATKQVLQVRPPVMPDGQWQQITIPSFEAGPGFQSYGGAADGKVHWPATSLSLILEKNGLQDKTKGTVWIDQVEFTVEGEPKPVSKTLEETAQGAQKVTLADFENDLSGFIGAIKQETSEGRDGKASAKMEADFSAVSQEPWITATKPLDLKNEIKALHFWVKSSQARQLTVRLVDSTDQNFQLRPAINPNGQWQEITLTSFEAGPGFESFGGAKDGKVHWPAKSLSFILEKSGLEGGKGSILIDGVEVYLNPERIVGQLTVGQKKIGNVFLLSEQVTIPVETEGDKVTWSATDFWGQPAGEGTATVADKSALITPEIKHPGYFLLHLVAEKGGAPLAKGDTTFVVTTPFDLAKVKDSPFGMMTHFAQNWDVDLLPLVGLAGAKSIRDELYWGQVEEKKGVFSFREQFEKYMAAAKAEHINTLTVLSFANGNYDNGDTPHTPEAYEAYARYAEEILKKYGSQIQEVEIWNEYNGSFCAGPAKEDRPKFYNEMIKVAYGAIKKMRPDVKVVGVSAVGIPYPYLDSIFSGGGLQYMDAVSVHPYRYLSPPEGMERPFVRMQELMKKYNNGQIKPIWITELGWFVKGSDATSSVIVTEADQAKYLVRGYALSLASGVEKIYWYLFRDYDVFATMGIVRGPDDKMGRYAPKPGYAAYATMSRQLTGTHFDQREMTMTSDVYSLLFRNDAGECRVMWSITPVTIALKTTAPLNVVDMMGDSKTLTPANGEVQLPLTDAPLYVWGKVTGLPPAEKQAGVVVAQSEEEFSNVQGTDGWSYGFYATPAGGSYNPADFKPLPKYRITPWNYEWIGDPQFLTITPANAHPGTDNGKQIWAVRRYVSEVDGNVRLQGAASRPGAGDGTTVRIFVDGKPVWNQQLSGGQPADAKFDLTVPVKVGSQIDFSVDPGPALDTSYDATAFSATITHLP